MTLSIPIVILAGGASNRFGSPKGLAQLGDKTLIEHVFDRMAAQTSAPVLINAELTSDYAAFGDVIADPTDFSRSGPLAGLLAAMIWADTYDHQFVATVPLDAPLLPLNLLQRLNETGAPVYAAAEDNRHYVTGIWASNQQQALEEYLNSGQRSARGWVDACSATACRFDGPGEAEMFVNINTQGELDALAEVYSKDR